MLALACLVLPGASASKQSTTKILHSPADQYVGALSVEDPCLGTAYLETGRAADSYWRIFL